MHKTLPKLILFRVTRFFLDSRIKLKLLCQSSITLHLYGVIYIEQGHKIGGVNMFLMLTSIIASTIRDLVLFFGYVQNVNSFPQPLSAEEEQRYLEEYRKGNEDAKNILVERNLRLVAHIVKKYTNTGKDIDDLISIGTIGLIKAIITFNEEKGTRLATYAARCIENAIPSLRKHSGTRTATHCRKVYLICQR